MKLFIILILSIVLAGCTRDFVPPFDTFTVNQHWCDDSDTCTADVALLKIDPVNHDTTIYECSYWHRTICDLVWWCDTTDCDDGNACTEDVCYEVAQECRSTFGIRIDCNDNDPCTTDLPRWDCPDTVYCQNIQICDSAECFTNADCDDNFDCTADTCIDGDCYNPLSRIYAMCKDSMNYCIGAQCFPDTGIKNYKCVYFPVPGRTCDDGDACTIDSCQQFGCSNTQINCDDGDPCTDDDCINGSCENTEINCDDNVACTKDYCVKGCVNEDTCGVCPFDTLFNEIDWCKIVVCVVHNGVPYTFNTQRPCDDGNLCTNNYCHEGIDECIYPPVICDDGSGQPYCCVDGNCIVPCFQKNALPDGFYDMQLRQLTVPIHELPSGTYIQITDGILRFKQVTRY